MGIGTLYSTKGTIVGQAAGFIAAEGTPLPADHQYAFDESVWCSYTVNVSTATGGTFTLSFTGGPIPLGTTITTAAIAYNALASAVKSAIDAAFLAAGYGAYTATVSGTAPSFKVAVSGPGGSRVIVTATFTSLTGGGTPTITSPLWTPLGSTEQGWTSNYNVSTQDIRVEEQQTPVGRNITDATYEFSASLSEDTVQSLQFAMSSTKTVQAKTSTVFGAEQLALSPNLNVYAVALESQNRYSLPRLEYIPSATGAANVQRAYRRAAGQRLVPVTFGSICDPSQIVIRELTQIPS